MKKIYSGLILIIFTISLIMPVTTVYASDDREVISEVEAESNDIDSIPVWGGNYIQPNIENIDENNPAYFYTSTGIWQRKEGDTWSDEHVSETFRAGTWRYKCKVCIDNDSEYTDGSDGNLYKLAEKISLKINNESEQLIIEDSIIGSSYSNAIIYSKEYLIPEPSQLTVYNSNEMNIGTNTKGTSLKKLSAGTKQFKATWKAQKTETTGYELQYATNKTFTSGKKTIKIKKNKTTSSTVKKLKSKKKYYVRIRTYKTVSGKKFYSGWSKVLNVKTK